MRRITVKLAQFVYFGHRVYLFDKAQEVIMKDFESPKDQVNPDLNHGEEPKTLKDISHKVTIHFFIWQQL